MLYVKDVEHVGLYSHCLGYLLMSQVLGVWHSVETGQFCESRDFAEPRTRKQCCDPHAHSRPAVARGAHGCDNVYMNLTASSVICVYHRLHVGQLGTVISNMLASMPAFLEATVVRILGKPQRMVGELQIRDVETSFKSLYQQNDG